MFLINLPVVSVAWIVLEICLLQNELNSAFGTNNAQIERNTSQLLLDERALAYTKHQELYDELADRDTTNLSLEDTILGKQSEIFALEATLLQIHHGSLIPLLIILVAKPGLHLSLNSSWSYLPTVHLYHVLHLTSCQLLLLFFQTKTLSKLWSLQFIQQMCTVLLHETKICAAF